VSLRMDAPRASRARAGAPTGRGRDRSQPARAKCPLASGGADPGGVVRVAALGMGGGRGGRSGRVKARRRKSFGVVANRRLIALALVLIVLAMFQVWLRLQVRTVGYDLSAVRALNRKLENHRGELEIELATLRRRDRLAAESRRRLGLGAAKRGQVVDLR